MVVPVEGAVRVFVNWKIMDLFQHTEGGSDLSENHLVYSPQVSDTTYFGMFKKKV